MTTVHPHLRLSWTGTVGSNEVFSCSVSLRPDTSEWSALLVDAGLVGYLVDHLHDTGAAARFADLVSDVSAYFARTDTGISAGKGRLKAVKLAAIDATGHYAAAPLEAAVNVAGGHPSGADFPDMPHQCSRKITLQTAGDLRRVKGGWYNPCPTGNGFDSSSDLFSVANSASLAASTETFIQDLENVPGVDTFSYKVVVSSAGRHNRDGSVRLGPALYDVDKVGVGRRVDIQRRRANKVLETPSVVTVE